jgi:redox-regulated HSP33 family molecular chaperone
MMPQYLDHVSQTQDSVWYSIISDSTYEHAYLGGFTLQTLPGEEVIAGLSNPPKAMVAKYDIGDGDF